MNDEFSGELKSLVHTMSETIFGSEVRVELDSSAIPADALWAHIVIDGEGRTHVWVGPSRALVSKAAVTSEMRDGRPNLESAF